MTFHVGATFGVWSNSRVIVLCQDQKARILDFEAKKVMLETPLSAPPVCVCTAREKVIFGLTTGTCEVWSTLGPLTWRWNFDGIVGDGKLPVMHVGWVYPLETKLTQTNHELGKPVSTRIIVNKTPSRASPDIDYLDDYLDVFSPVKRTAEVFDDAQRKAKRLKQSKKSENTKLDENRKSLKVPPQTTELETSNRTQKGITPSIPK